MKDVPKPEFENLNGNLHLAPCAFNQVSNEISKSV